MKYYVAAEGWRHLRSKDLRPERVTTGPGSRVPAGDAHAVPVETFTTVCGLEVDDLAPFETTDFEQHSFLQKCHACEVGVAAG